MWLPIATTVVAVVGLLVAERVDHARARGILKPLASTGFVATAWVAGAADSVYGRWVLVALLLCWLGDVLLISRGEKPFRWGVFAFLLGHVAFGKAFLELGVAWPVVGVSVAVAAVLGGVVGAWLWAGIPRVLRIPIAVYIAVIAAMVGLAIGAWNIGGQSEVAIAAISFYLSDLSVALDRFGKRGFANRVWGLPTYYGAQLLFAASIAM